MSIIIPANTLAAGGFNVDNSSRFGVNTYMHKVLGSDNEKDTWTFSLWVKRGNIGSVQRMMTHNGSTSGKFFYLRWEANEQLHFHIGMSDGNFAGFDTTQVFRDRSAWYHIVCAVDTTQATEGNRVKIYVNGSQITAFGTANYPARNVTALLGNTSTPMVVGGLYGSGFGISSGSPQEFYDGYLAEVCFIDDLQLAPDSFGEFDEDSGIWKAIDVSGLTFGTDGFHLDFKASGNLGNDANGGTDLTEVNLAATDQSTDTCTNNFATLNPLHSIGAASELSQGNLEYDPAGHHRIISTIAPTSGKWYAEVKGIDNPDKFNAGVAHYPMPANGSASSFAFGQGVNADVGRFANDFGVKANGDYGNSNSYSSYMASLESENNNIVGIYLDLDNYKIYFSKNGTLVSSTGKNLTNNGEPYGFISVGEAATFQWNFGNPSFALANTAITDDNGFGAFEYSPNITGDSAAKKFYALNTKNLAEYG